ncbi:CynX/NimT family MFS transporter [Microbacterium indicum]|uniref:CynX/NimT family MFS transporter n=1 Tax=Microbacterium indicum TaxID=358100 RepID=UPI00040A6CA6|nr:MFS transporter [Microbacterium indicum]
MDSRHDTASDDRTPPRGDPRSAASLGLLAVGLLLVGLNLRIGVASVGPVLVDIRASLGLSAAGASLLTAIPVVAFGAFAFLTPSLTRRFGLHRLLGLALLVLVAGILLRSLPGVGMLFVGTVLIGAAIGIGNVVMPPAIKKDFARWAGLMMGLYSTALFVGAALASGLTVPMLAAVGRDWRAALAIWAIPAVLALVVWIPQIVRSARDARGTAAPSLQGEPPFRAILRDPVALSVTALMGLQSMSYYAALTWIPTVLVDAGLPAGTAGWMLSFSAFPGIVASLVTPALARRVRVTWSPIVIAAALTAVAIIGLLFAPVPEPAAYVWMALLGLGQGASISLSLSFIVWRSPDTHHTGHVSTMAQGFGYLFAGLGPIGLGVLHAATDGWVVPLVALVVMLAVQALAGVAASRPRHVGSRLREEAIPR